MLLAIYKTLGGLLFKKGTRASTYEVSFSGILVLGRVSFFKKADQFYVVFHTNKQE